MSRRRGGTPSIASPEFFQAKNLGKRIFGVVVEPIPLSQLPEQMTAGWQVCDPTDASNPMPFRVARLPFVRETGVSFPRAGLEALARGLQKAGLDASTFVWPPDGEPDRSPYPGLRALEEVDAAVFFGREASIVRAIDQMRLVRERDVEQLSGERQRRFGMGRLLTIANRAIPVI